MKYVKGFFKAVLFIFLLPISCFAAGLACALQNFIPTIFPGDVSYEVSIEVS